MAGSSSARAATFSCTRSWLQAGVDALMSRHRNPDPRLKDHILRSHTEAAEGWSHSDGGGGAAGIKARALNHSARTAFRDLGPIEFSPRSERHYADR